MNRFYSIILLISFMVGVLYPAAPMIEYFFSDAQTCHISVLQDHETINCEHDCPVNPVATESCECCEDTAPDQLLDVDNHPIPLNNHFEKKSFTLTETADKYIVWTEDVLTFYQHPTTPPPKIS